MSLLKNTIFSGIFKIRIKISIVGTISSLEQKKKREATSVEESESTSEIDAAGKKGKTRRSKRAIDEDHSDDTDRKTTSRAKYMRDARRVLTKTDYEVVTVKHDDTKRRTKMPTARKMKRQELRKSFESPKKAVQQPRRRNH